jgi:hypothetical protein
MPKSKIAARIIKKIKLVKVAELLRKISLKNQVVAKAVNIIFSSFLLYCVAIFPIYNDILTYGNQFVNNK